MNHNPLIGPVIALVGWSILVLLWLGYVRFGALKKVGRGLGKAKPGSRGQDLEGVLPPAANWPAHNYAHLMEQPTIFYAITLALVALDDWMELNLWLAWAYVVIRVIHSFVQITNNNLKFRFPLFILSTFCLIALTIHAATSFYHG